MMDLLLSRIPTTVRIGMMMTVVVVIFIVAIAAATAVIYITTYKIIKFFGIWTITTKVDNNSSTSDKL